MATPGMRLVGRRTATAAAARCCPATGTTRSAGRAGINNICGSGVGSSSTARGITTTGGPSPYMCGVYGADLLASRMSHLDLASPVHAPSPCWTQTQTRGFARKSAGTTLTQAEMVARQEALEADVEADGDDDGGPVVVVPRDRSNPIHTYAEDFGPMSNEALADSDTIPGWDLIHSPPRKLPRGALVGRVVSDKMQKTVSVEVDRYRMIPKLRIRRRYTRKFMAHDEEELCQMGDLVMIVPCQRLSRRKHFMVREILRAKGVL